MAPRRRRANKRRSWDGVKLEYGYDARQKWRRVPEVEARLGRLVDAQNKPRTRAEIERSIRREGLNPRVLFLHTEFLIPPLPAALQRSLAQFESTWTPSRLEKFAKELFIQPLRITPQVSTGPPGSSRVVVVSQGVIPRVVEAIYKRHPEIRSWLAELGLTVEEGTSLLYEVLDYPAPRGKESFERRVDSRGGVLWEALLAFDPNVVLAERLVASKNAIDWIWSEPARFGAPRGGVTRLAAQIKARFAAAESSAAGYGRGIVETEGTPSYGEADFLTKNLWLVRFTEIRDEAGRLVMDHKRGLVSYSSSGIDVTPVGVGESKFGSKAAKLLRQELTNIFRTRKTFRAANLPDPGVLPVNVRWGKSLVVIAQTEAARGVTPPADIGRRVSRAAGKELNITFVKAGTPEGARRSRDIVRSFLNLLATERLGEE